MLIKIDGLGRPYPITEVPYPEEYERLCSLVKDFEEVKTYVAETCLPLTKFTVGIVFPKGRWEGTPLMKIWDVFAGSHPKEAETQSGFLLGKIFQDVAIKDDSYWKCTGVDLQGRGFDTAFYWR